MAPLYSDAVGELIERCGPEPDAVLETMAERAERENFPVVGPAVGRTMALCARMVGARSAFELGSGFGYSAYWLARALPADGEVVLTDRDADLLADARSYFEAGGMAEMVRTERGDAVEIAAESDDTYDVVLLDHDTDRYVEGFEVVRDLVAPGGVILTDNVITYSDVQTPEGILAALDGEDAPNDRMAAVADFFDHVQADPAFETVLLPLDDGLTISYRLDD